MGMGKRKERVGEVVSNKMTKTVVVKINRVVSSPMIGKQVRRHTKIKAHDEQNQCQIGDMVRVVETRPLSKDKNWRVVEIVKH